MYHLFSHEYLAEYASIPVVDEKSSIGIELKQNWIFVLCLLLSELIAVFWKLYEKMTQVFDNIVVVKLEVFLHNFVFDIIYGGFFLAF